MDEKTMPSSAEERAQLTSTNTHIYDSYLIRSKDDIRAFIQNLREQCDPDMAITQRTLSSLVAEWRSHNFFYYLHVFRSRTKDVDLERCQSWWREAFCRVVSFFYFW